MRYLVLSPEVAGTTADINSSVCRAPFMIASTFPDAANSTALKAAASLCSVSIISQLDKSILASLAAHLIFAIGPINTGVIKPALTES